MHRLTANVDTWNYRVLALHDRYRCICIDRRGHGDSDKPASEYSYDKMCGDLQAFVRALDLDDVTLVGWSMGAGVALKYVADFNADGRVTKLVMVGAATPRFRPTETEPFGMDDTTAQAVLEGLRIAYPETTAAFGDRNFYRTDREATERWFLSLWLKTPSYETYKCFKNPTGRGFT